MSESFTTPEGFELPKPLLLPEVRDFAELFEYLREWDHATMTGNPIVSNPELVPKGVLAGNVVFGPLLSAKLPAGQRTMAIRPTSATVAALDGAWSDGRVSFELIYHRNNNRILVLAKENQMIRSHYLAYIGLGTIPEGPAGTHVVNGEEINHADSPAEAKRNRAAEPHGQPVSANPNSPLVAAVLNDAQQEALAFYQAYNVPATYFVGVPNVDGSAEVIAIGTDSPAETFIWSFRIGADGDISAAEAKVGEFSTGIDI